MVPGTHMEGVKTETFEGEEMGRLEGLDMDVEIKMEHEADGERVHVGQLEVREMEDGEMQVPRAASGLETAAVQIGQSAGAGAADVV